MSPHTTSAPPKTGDFTLVRKDRGKNKGGGLAFLIHNTIEFEELPIKNPDNFTETQRIRIRTSPKQWLTLTHFDSPPTSSCEPGFAPALDKLLDADSSLVLGDANAHNELWNSTLSDDRGELFADIITQSSHGILNGDQPTRSPTNGPEASPDISLATPDILISAEWSTQKALSSDHLPIIVKLPKANNSPLQAPKRTFVNLAKADWNNFQLQTESQFADTPLPTDVRNNEKTFRNIILAASKQNIPAGRYPEFRPNIPEDASRLMKERDETRKNNPTAPELHQLNSAIENKISQHIKKKWHETVEKVNAHSNLAALWSTIRRLSKGPQPESNRPIIFKGKPVTNTKNIATNFNLQFSSVTQKSSNKRTRVISNKIKSLPFPQHTFTYPKEVQNAINRSKPSKAYGPDDITMIHLKHLGPYGIQFLTQLFNLSVQNSIIPDIW